MNRNEVTDAINAADARLERIRASLARSGEVPLASGEWRVRDAVSHVAARANPVPTLHRWLATADAGPGTQAAPFDIHAINAEQVSTRAGTSIGGLIDEARAAHQAALRELSGLDDALLERSFPLPAMGRDVTGAEFLVLAGPGHEGRHLDEIEQVLIPEGGSDSFFETLYTQRAIRSFRPDPVPEALLMRVIEAATKAPSGSNLQPWAFIVVDRDEDRAEIARLLREHLLQDEAMLGYFTRGAASEDRTQRLMLKGALALAENLATAPALIIPCLYPATSSLHAGSSIYPAVQNLLLAARALGLGTVLTTFNARIEPPLREMLGLPEDAQPVALIPIGFPAARFGPTKRRPAAEVTHWGRWGGQRG